jgi:hypothetical protein
MKWIGQHIVDFIARFRSDVYLESVAESTQDHVVGIDANGKLYKQDVSVGDITAVTITTDSGGGSAASNTSGSADFSILGATGVGVTNSGTTITATAVPSEIDHDSLQNFVTAEHVDWAGSSAGTIHSSNIPTLNQNTTGSAATLTTPRAINGVNFDGSGPITVPAAGSTLTDTVTVANGGTGLTTVGANQILTGNATGALTSEANFTFGVDRLHIGADDEITPQIRMQNDENTVTVGIADSADNLITGSADGDFVINSTGDHNIVFGQNNAVAVKIDTDGDFNFNRRFTVTGGTDGEYEGDVVYFGGTTSMTVGKIYHYKSDGTWEEADADAVATSDGLLAVALGAASDTNGMLLRGMVTLDHDPGSVGDVLFLSTVSGQATSTAPSANNDIVRVIGYQVAHASDGKIWFNPDSTFVEVTA